MLARSKNITVAENITSRRNELFKVLRKNPVGTTLTPESFFAHRKISPKELGRVLAKVNSVDEIPKVMAFIEESAKAGKITNNATFFKKSFLLRETIKADPHAQNQRLNGASRLKTAVEKIDVK